jgi:glycosyltransferase involved in cell wall biosynthesis
LSRLPFGIPLDLLLGTGDYIFPNFRNWPLLFSKSYTYIHDACFAVFPEYVEEKNRAYLNKYMSMWLKRTDKILTVSESAKKEIQQYLDQPDDRVTVVGNAVNQEEFFPRSYDEVLKVREKYGLGENYFLYLGNIEPRKNLTTLVTAYGSQSDLRESTELFLVGGDGWLNDDIYSAIDDARKRGYKIIKNKSYVPDKDIPALMTGAQALVQPSWHEGFGLAVIQALACGTPSICSDIPGLRNAIAGNEHVVTLFDPHNVDDLSEILKNAAKSRKSTTNITLPSWDTTVQTLLNTISKGDRKI